MVGLARGVGGDGWGARARRGVWAGRRSGEMGDGTWELGDGSWEMGAGEREDMALNQLG